MCEACFLDRFDHFSRFVSVDEKLAFAISRSSRQSELGEKFGRAPEAWVVMIRIVSRGMAMLLLLVCRRLKIKILVDVFRRSSSGDCSSYFRPFVIL